MNDTIWHRRFGHLSRSGLHSLVREVMEKGLEVDCSQELDFCESCAKEKIIDCHFQNIIQCRLDNHWSWCIVTFVEKLVCLDLHPETKK